MKPPVAPATAEPRAPPTVIGSPLIALDTAYEAVLVVAPSATAPPKLVPTIGPKAPLAKPYADAVTKFEDLNSLPVRVLATS